MESAGLVPRDVRTGAETDRRWAVYAAAPADRRPEPPRHQHRAVHRAGAGPRRPVRRNWRATPTCRPRCALALRAKFGLDDPIWLRYLHWLVAMLQGDWGFSFVSRMDVDHADLAAPADDAPGDRLVADRGAADRAAGRGLFGDPALFGLRPDRQHARLHRLFAADLLHRASCSS